MKETINYPNPKKETVLDFWHALLLMIGINLSYFFIYIPTALLLINSYKTEPFNTINFYFRILIYIPFIYWYAKKTNANIKSTLHIPNLYSVLKVLLITILAFIALAPTIRSDEFFSLLRDFKLRIVGGSIRPLVPFIDFRLMIIGPIVEELFYRGIILKSFLKKYSPLTALFLSSILFGIHHYDNFFGHQAHSYYNIIFYICGGLLYGIIYYASNSIIITSLAHICWNTLTIYKFEIIELDSTNWILHLSVYTIATTGLIYMLWKGYNHKRKNERTPEAELV